MTTISLEPTVIDIVLVARANYAIEFEILKDGAAEDINDDTITFTAMDAYGGNVTIAAIENGPGDHALPLAGKTVFELTKEMLSPEGGEADWVYEVRRIEASGREHVHIQGTLTIRPSVGGN